MHTLCDSMLKNIGLFKKEKKKKDLHLYQKVVCSGLWLLQSVPEVDHQFKVNEAPIRVLLSGYLITHVLPF